MTKSPENYTEAERNREISRACQAAQKLDSEIAELKRRQDEHLAWAGLLIEEGKRREGLAETRRRPSAEELKAEHAAEKAPRTAAKLQNSQNEFEKWAHEQLVPWGPSFSDDIRAFVAAVYPPDAFGLKIEEPRQLVNAATVYEYARESRTVRGLAIMMHRILKRDRQRIAKLEKHRESEQNPRGTQSGLPDSEEDYLVPVFEGVEQAQLERTLGPWAGFLGEVGDLLAKNASFKDAWEKERQRIMGSLWETIETKKGPARIFRFSGNYGREIPPIEPALGWSPDKVSDCWSFVAAPRDRARGGATEDPSGEVNRRPGLTVYGHEHVIFRINWSGRLDKEICESFERFVGRHRPDGFPGPDSEQSANQSASWETHLKELAAMRRMSWKKLDAEESKTLSSMAVNARDRLGSWFRFEQTFENARTLKKRPRPPS